MTQSELPPDTDDERPNLRVVGDDEATDGDGVKDEPESEPESGPRSKRSSRKSRGERGDKEKPKGERRKPERDAAPETVQDPLVAARAVLAGLDPESAYKALLSLVRPGHHDLLQTLDYTPALEFHDPTCVKVDPDPSGLETVDLYAHAAFPEFDRILA